MDLCALYGYYAEEHVVQTGDGYLLAIHRLAWKKDEDHMRSQSIRKPVVYMHHGLMMNSEVWVCLTDEERCLPFKLVEKGYDVWVSVAKRIKIRANSLVWQQSRKQILQEVHSSFSNRHSILELFYG